MHKSITSSPRRVYVTYVNANDATAKLLRETEWLQVSREYHDWCMPGTWRRIMCMESRG